MGRHHHGQRRTATTATHQLQLGATRRFSSGLAFGVEYMWTRALGPHVYGALPMDYRNVRLDRGNLDFLKRHHASINYVYDLPFGKGQRFLSSLPGTAEKLIGGWQLAGISYLMTGDPYSVTFTSTTLGWPSSRADIVGNPSVSNPSLTQWFNPAAFAVPQAIPVRQLGSQHAVWAGPVYIGTRRCSRAPSSPKG